MNARRVSFELLKDIIIDKQYSNLSLRKQLEKVDVNERAFVTQLVYGTIENYICIRYMWHGFAKTLPSKEACVLLDMSVYELLWMKKAPAYASINEAVEIAKHQLHGHLEKMVNAILRKVMQQGMLSIQGSDEEVLSIETSHPLWLIHMWNAQYGRDICAKIAHDGVVTRPVCTRVNTLRICRDELLAQDTLFQKGELSEDACIYNGGNVAATPWFQEGFVSIQDEASQLVGILMDVQPHERILDVCSAPGSKACHMAQRMGDQGEILCGDIHEHRVALIEEGAKHLGLQSIVAKHMDATTLDDIEDASFDRVLCDVPCSGYGTLGHKSDIKIHMKSSDMDTLIPLQAKILSRASQKVKVQGILCYSTCTLNKKENEKQIEKFLQEHDNFTLISQRTIFPFEYHSDGFYMAKLKRND